jgi:hypothetical protein
LPDRVETGIVPRFIMAQGRGSGPNKQASKEHGTIGEEDGAELCVARTMATGQRALLFDVEATRLHRCHVSSNEQRAQLVLQCCRDRQHSPAGLSVSACSPGAGVPPPWLAIPPAHAGGARWPCVQCRRSQAAVPSVPPMAVPLLPCPASLPLLLLVPHPMAARQSAPSTPLLLCLFRLSRLFAACTQDITSLEWLGWRRDIREEKAWQRCGQTGLSAGNP